MTAIGSVSSIVLDCADPVALAAFYQRVTGWELTASEPEFAALGGGSGAGLGFVRVAGYRAPAWPADGPHVHLDFTVADQAAAVEELLALGASRAELQPGEGQWTVLTDPAGHPFCVSAG
ncbi:VOC family protein [Kitasatospora viridis]|uniref:Putative enzyme related to lactoylglutathione lyase n=1 Tax=Kitasatospora viridis TaxID=281105 RepID=A0A561UI82_9ACTN|nr:VOC family protein [Kitasatospora viridis]TWF99059.1 putative enzyme related to lactoylglutathione lyase [Kitasatospora viridis]